MPLNLVFVDSIDVSLASSLLLTRGTHAFKLFNGAFGYAREVTSILGEVFSIFDGCFVIQLKCSAFSRFKFKFLSCNSAPNPITHFDSDIPSPPARLLAE